MIVANVKYASKDIHGHSFDTGETWERETLDEMQKDFWRMFQRHHGMTWLKFQEGTLHDTETGNTWEVNSSGRKTYDPSFKKYRFKGKYSVFYGEYYCEPLTPFDQIIYAKDRDSAETKLLRMLFRDVDRYYYDTSIEFEIEGEEV